MASQANDNSNYLVEEKGDIVIVRSKDQSSPHEVSFYLFNDKIIDKINEINPKDKVLSAQDILAEYGLVI